MMSEHVCSDEDIKPLVVSYARRFKGLQLEETSFARIITGVASENSYPNDIGFVQTSP
jgi:hypothetical protein